VSTRTRRASDLQRDLIKASRPTATSRKRALTFPLPRRRTAAAHGRHVVELEPRVRQVRVDLLPRSTHRVPLARRDRLRHRARVLLAQCRVWPHPRLPARSVSLGAETMQERALTSLPTPAATSFLHICALLMVTIMILHIRSKYTAVGRKEILVFFYMYFLEELLAIFLDSAIIPPSSDVYAVRPSSHSLVEHPLRAPADAPRAHAVVRRDSHWLDMRNILVPARQRLCRLPGRRGRHALVSLGACLLSLASLIPTHVQPSRSSCKAPQQSSASLSA